MTRLYFFNKPNPNLTKEQKANIIHDINMTNFARMKLLLIIFIVIEILFILFNDIPYLINPSSNVIWNNRTYFILHLLILFISIIGLILIKISTKYNKNNFKNISNLLVPTLTILLLSLMAIINGLDQIKPGSISSVFIANLIIFSFLGHSTFCNFYIISIDH